jgi:hypothetical protein
MNLTNNECKFGVIENNSCRMRQCIKVRSDISELWLKVTNRDASDSRDQENSVLKAYTPISMEDFVRMVYYAVKVSSPNFKKKLSKSFLKAH